MFSLAARTTSTTTACMNSFVLVFKRCVLGLPCPLQVRAAFAAAGILIVGGWVDAKKSVGYVDWALLLLVGSALGLSKAISNSGLASYAGNAIRESGMSASTSLYVLYGFTMVWTASGRRGGGRVHICFGFFGLFSDKNLGAGWLRAAVQKVFEEIKEELRLPVFVGGDGVRVLLGGEGDAVLLVPLVCEGTRYVEPWFRYRNGWRGVLDATIGASLHAALFSRG